LSGSAARVPACAAIFAFLLITASCGSSDRKTDGYEPFNERPSEADPVQNSGKSLSGSYSVTSSDSYSAEAGAKSTDKNLSFDSTGRFIRETVRDGVVIRREKGSYVIGTHGEFVLFVEEIGGEQLQAARADRYKIVKQSDDEITVERSPGSQLILKRK